MSNVSLMLKQTKVLRDLSVCHFIYKIHFYQEENASVAFLIFRGSATPSVQIDVAN